MRGKASIPPRLPGNGAGHVEKETTRFRDTLAIEESGLPLAGLETRVAFVNDVDPPLAADDPAVPMPTLGGFQ